MLPHCRWPYRLSLHGQYWTVVITAILIKRSLITANELQREILDNANLKLHALLPQQILIISAGFSLY